METVEVIRINKNRFKAFVMFSKLPGLVSLFSEIEWYSVCDSRILGTIAICSIDKDFNALILCRDEVGKYKAIKTKINFINLGEAQDWLTANMKRLALNNQFIHPQGDLDKGIDLFAIAKSKAVLHPYFKLLNENESFAPAKKLLQELTKFFNDIDGNFVEQFQSENGFDARIWELYMFCFLTEQECSIERAGERPDFVVRNANKTVAIEAVIVGRKEKIKPIANLLDGDIVENLEERKKAMPLKYSSALVQKLKKKYWELPNVKEIPLLFAIADFHEDLSMTWSFNSLIEYLYGYKHSAYYDKDGTLIINPIKTEDYTKKSGSTVEAGFFFLPDSENISGVLFSSMGTLSKFTRIGIQSGFSDQKRMRVVRSGTHYDHDPNASKPNFYSYIVNENSEESWSEGMNLYHNPNAKFPLDRSFFPNIGHHYFKNGQIESIVPDFHPFNSFQMNIQGV